MLNIQNKIEFENNLWLGSIDPSTFNSSEENRILAVTDMASITMGKLGFDYEIQNDGRELAENHWSRRVGLYNKLLKESAGNPSTPFEFVPVTWQEDVSILWYPLYWKYCNIVQLNRKVYQSQSNYRNTLINFPYDDKQGIVYNTPEEVEGFKIIVGRVPMKVISHLRTHRAFSWLVESSRNKKYLNSVEFWYPSWWDEEIYTRNKKIADYNIVSDLKVELAGGFIKPEEATMELSDRRLVHFAMAAWKQDSSSWDNLFKVRGDKTGTMNITGQVVDNIKKLIL